MLDRLFLPNASPISSIITLASMPVGIVTIMLTDEQVPPWASVPPTGYATRVASVSGDGAVELHVADNGAIVSALCVKSVPAGNDWPDLSVPREPRSEEHTSELQSR